MVKGEALADVQTAHDFEAHAVDQAQASPIGDEQSLDSALMIVPRHPFESHWCEDLTHESAHGGTTPKRRCNTAHDSTTT